MQGLRWHKVELLPDEKLSDRAAALESVSQLSSLPDLRAVLVGDGQSVFRDAPARLRELVRRSSRGSLVK